MADGMAITAPDFTKQHSSVYVDPNDAASYQLSEKNPQIFNMDVNYANENKWYAYWPLEDVLGKKYKNLNMHITKFNIPQLQQSSMEIPFRGYTKEMPTKVLMAGSKELNIEYIVDSDWENYRSLYALISNINGTINPVSEDEKKGIVPAEYLPLRIYLLGPYKKKIIQFLFENTWIKLFNDLSLDVNSPNEVHHSVTCVFDRYLIEDV